jgi:hypothetical protein
MIVAASLVGPGDHVWLPHKLRVLSSFCDRICLLFDRCPEGEAIAAAYPKVEYRRWTYKPVPQTHADGANWNEGEMRQEVWGMAIAHNPRFVILSDADESPAPSIAEWLASGPDESVDCWYADWVNLIHDAGHAIGGARSLWSFQNPGTNKKGMVIRYRPGREYRYRPATRHVRMEPSPLSEGATIHDATHRLCPVPLLHYRWAAWPRWSQSEQSKLPAWATWPPADAEIVDVPRSLLWRWSACDLLRNLPGPIAVVGNGVMRKCGPEIDRHKTVIRLNNWRIAGHEADVGTNVDVWCTNCWENVEQREWTGPMLTVYHDECQQDRIGKWLGMYPHMACPDARWYPNVQKMKEGTGRSNPSTGLILLSKLAELAKDVTAFGFDGLRSGHYWSLAHVHAHDDELPSLIQLSDRIRFR